MKEETQLEIDTIEFLGTYYTEAEYKKDSVYLYCAKAKESDVIIDNEEIIESQWCTKDQIPQELSPLARRALELVQSK